MRARSLAYGPRRYAEDEPFSAMNITPLIDVMLVILVMMILSVPLMTHEVPIDLPQPGPVSPEQAIVHIVALDAHGAVALDGRPIDALTLGQRLAALTTDRNNEIQIQADGAAPYERFDQTLAVIKRAGVTRLGFIGNERFQNFDGLK